MGTNQSEFVLPKKNKIVNIPAFSFGTHPDSVFLTVKRVFQVALWIHFFSQSMI